MDLNLSQLQFIESKKGEYKMSDQNLKDPQHPSGPVQVKNLMITVDRNLCIGTQQCVDVAAKTYILDGEGVSSILATADSEEEKLIIEAAQGCPMNAIFITDKDANPVYPK
jgi:ferredoxin